MRTSTRTTSATCRSRSTLLPDFTSALALISKVLAFVLFLGSFHAVKAAPAPLASGVVPDGVQIYYQIHGSQDGPPVLLIHGFGDFFDENRYEWVIEFFSGYKLIALDVRGHGRSGKPFRPGDYGLALVDDLTRLLGHLSLEDVHIIGVSMGGIVGLKFASLYPERVRSLTLVGQGLVPAESFQLWVDMGKTVVEAEERSAEQHEKLHLYAGFLMGYPPLRVTELEAKSLQVPLLIVMGEDDERLKLARKLKDVYPKTNLIIAPGFDHFSIMNRDSPFYLAVEGFLTRSAR